MQRKKSCLSNFTKYYITNTYIECPRCFTRYILNNNISIVVSTCNADGYVIKTDQRRHLAALVPRDPLTQHHADRSVVYASPVDPSPAVNGKGHLYRGWWVEFSDTRTFKNIFLTIFSGMNYSNIFSQFKYLSI